MECQLLSFASCPNLLILQPLGTLFFLIFVCFWLHRVFVLAWWIFVPACGSFGMACGLFIGMCGPFSICGTPALEHAGSAVVLWRLSCPEHVGSSFPDQGSNARPLLWKEGGFLTTRLPGYFMFKACLGPSNLCCFHLLRTPVTSVPGVVWHLITCTSYCVFRWRFYPYYKMFY